MPRARATPQPLHRVVKAPTAGQAGEFDDAQSSGFLSFAVNNNTQFDLLVSADAQPVSGASGTYLVGAGRTVRLPFSGTFLLYQFAAAVNPNVAAPAAPQADFFLSPLPTDYSDVPIAGAAVAAGAPVQTGALVMIGSATAPTGYLACDGSAVSRTQYSALFTVVGTGFGAGDGSTTFNVPNMTGQGLVVGGVQVAFWYIKT